MARKSVSATLTLVGDPSLGFKDINQNVEVIFYMPSNYFRDTQAKELHYTSDTYSISGIVHSIKSGEYTTTLQLERAG